jgi:hypothetical protein
MKIASAGIPRCFLLVFSIIFVGMPPPSQLISQAKLSSIPVTKKELNPIPDTTQRPAPTQTPAGQGGEPSQAVKQFQVEEGTSKPVTLELNNDCRLPHQYRVNSDKKNFKFEGQTDSVVFQPGLPKNFTIRIDAKNLKQGVSRVMVSVECLDCKNEPACGPIKKVFAVEVAVTKQSSPTLQGNSKIAASPPTGSSQGTQGDKEVQELSINGPQFPATLNLSDLKFKAFVMGNGPLFLDYELEQPGHVILLITVKRKLPYIYRFPETRVGRHEKLIKLPAYFGDGPLVATYSIKAVSERMFGLVPLIIHAFAVGEEAVGSSGLGRVSFEPRNINVVRGVPDRNATYSFRAVRPFSGGADADIRRINGSSATSVSVQHYSRRIERDETITGVWDCKRDRTPSVGRHKLLVKAWFTVQDRGASSFVFSPSLVNVQ